MVEDQEKENKVIEEAPDKKKEVNPSEKKAVLSTFIMLFPGLLLTILVGISGDLVMSGLAIALFFFQAILIKNFVEAQQPRDFE